MCAGGFGGPFEFTETAKHGCNVQHTLDLVAQNKGGVHPRFNHA